MKKVSIIIPCFNGEKFVNKCLDSILNQTYENIEIIFINDGSTDKTYEVISPYIEKLKETGREFYYIYQKQNRGQAEAINKGIKIFSGQYLMFLDSDDFINHKYLEKMVNFLENHTEYGMVRCSTMMYVEENLDKPYRPQPKDKDCGEYIFESLIIEKARCTNGRYMIRSSAFLDSNPKREIYTSRAGQNWQILLPIAYKYKCGYLDEYLFNYLIRKDSHSRSPEYNTKEGALKRSYEHEDILINVLNTIMKGESKYHYIVRKKYIDIRIKIAYKYKYKYKDEALLKEQDKKLRYITGGMYEN